MPRYEVRLMQTFEADDPVAAAERFIMSIVDNGLRTFMYRVQDLDADPNAADLRYVQDRTALTIWEAADMYGVDLAEEDLDDDDDDDEDGTDIGEFEPAFIPGDRAEDPDPYTVDDTDDTDSVVNIDSD